VSIKLYPLKAEVWLYPSPPAGGGGWHFISVPKKQAADIKKRFHGKQRGWGSLPVVATIGKTSWKTSIFPDKKSGTYLLPLKAEVRKKEGVTRGEVINVAIEIKA
jgi:hypothetical protein